MKAELSSNDKPDVDLQVEDATQSDTKEASKGMFQRMMFLYGQEDLSAQLTARRFWAGVCSSKTDSKSYFPSSEFERKQHERKRVLEASAAAMELKYTQSLVEAQLRKKIPKGKQFLVYDLPVQTALVSQDQSQTIAKEGTILLRLKEKRERQQRIEFQSLLESMKMEGEVAGDLKLQAQRAFLNGNMEEALLLIRQAQVSFGATKYIRPASHTQVVEKVQTPVEHDAKIPQKGVPIVQEPAMEDSSAKNVEKDQEEQKVTVPDESAEIYSSISEQSLRNYRLHNVMMQQQLQEEVPSQVDLHNHKLLEVPLWVVEGAPRMFSINLHHNLLTTIPEMFLNNTLHLTSIDVSYNKLHRLPPSFGNIRRLRSANLSHNHLIGLPSTMGCLSALELLNLESNELSKLPPSMGNLKRLRKLFLEGNKPFSLPPQDVIEQGVQEILSFLGKVFSDGRAAMVKLWSELDGHSVDLARMMTIMVNNTAEKEISCEKFYNALRWEHRIMVSKRDVQSLFMMIDDDGDGLVQMRDFLYLRDNAKEHRRLQHAARKVILRMQNMLLNKFFDIWRDGAEELRHQKQVVKNTVKRMHNVLTNKLLMLVLNAWRAKVSAEYSFSSGSDFVTGFWESGVSPVAAFQGSSEFDDSSKYLL